MSLLRDFLDHLRSAVAVSFGEPHAPVADADVADKADDTAQDDDLRWALLAAQFPF